VIGDEPERRGPGVHRERLAHEGIDFGNGRADARQADQRREAGAILTLE
jgi:hypothetical protein